MKELESKLVPSMSNTQINNGHIVSAMFGAPMESIIPLAIKVLKQSL